MDGQEELGLTPDAGADTSPADTSSAPNGLDATPAASTDEFGQPIPEKEPTVEELLAHYTPKDEPVDPNAPPEPVAAIPEAFQEALGISEYVKEPEQMAQAVRAAAEQWDIENGKVPAYTMLEGLRGRNPEAFNRIIEKDIIPYIEHITGKKLGGEQAAPDPNDPNAKITALEQRLENQRQQEQTQRETAARNETISRANALGSQKVAELLKDSPFAGREEQMFLDTIAQISKMKMDPERIMQETMAGNFSNFEKALKAVQAQKMKEALEFNKALTAHYKRQKNTLPSAKGGGVKTTVGDGKIGPSSTKAELAAYLAGETGE